MTNLAIVGDCTLYQAIGPEQLAALIRADWRSIEPGRGGEHFYFLKLHQRYAEMSARRLIAPRFGRAYVVQLQLPSTVLAAFALESIAYDEHLEYRIPRESLQQLSDGLMRPLRLVTAFRGQHSYSVPRAGIPPPSLLV